MTNWTLRSGGINGRTSYWRRLHDRFAAYVDYDNDWDAGAPLSFHWSVQDGSCSRVLAQGVVSAEQGLVSAQLAADNAAARLFAGRYA